MKKYIGSGEDGVLYIAYEFKCELPMNVIKHVLNNLACSITFIKKENDINLIFVLPETVTVSAINDYVAIVDIVLHTLKTIEKYTDECCAGVRKYLDCIRRTTENENTESDSSSQQKDNND